LLAELENVSEEEAEQMLARESISFSNFHLRK